MDYFDAIREMDREKLERIAILMLGSLSTYGRYTSMTFDEIFEFFVAIDRENEEK